MPRLTSPGRVSLATVQIWGFSAIRTVFDVPSTNVRGRPALLDLNTSPLTA